jgi:hypothetical protein
MTKQYESSLAFIMTKQYESSLAFMTKQYESSLAFMTIMSDPLIDDRWMDHLPHHGMVGDVPAVILSWVVHPTAIHHPTPACPPETTNKQGLGFWSKSDFSQLVIIWLPTNGPSPTPTYHPMATGATWTAAMRAAWSNRDTENGEPPIWRVGG